MNRMKRGSRVKVLVVLAGIVGLAPAAWANTWSAAVPGYWNDGTKWSDGVPPAAGTAAVLNVVGASYEVTYTNPVAATIGAVTITNTTGNTTTLNINTNGFKCGAVSLAYGAVNISTGGTLTCTSFTSTKPSTLTINGGAYLQTAGNFGNSSQSANITVNMSNGSLTNSGGGTSYMSLLMSGGTVVVGGTAYDILQNSTISGGIYTNYSSTVAYPRSLIVSNTAKIYFNLFRITGDGQTLDVNGGNVTVTGSSFDIGDNTLSGGVKNGTITQTGGDVTMAHANGLVIGKTSAGAFTGGTYQYQLQGGILNLEKITLSYPGYLGSNNLAFKLSGAGILNLGSGGIVNGGGTGVITVDLTGGTIGAMASWSSSVPMSLTNTVVFRCADTNSVARNITLSDALGGTGGFIKTGGGDLQLNGTHTFSGASIVSNGTLRVTGVKAGSGALTIAGGMLSGQGTLAGTVTNRAIISANETTTVGTMTITNLVMAENSSYTWNYGDASNDLIDVKGFLTLPNVATVTVSKATGQVNALPASATLFTAPTINNSSAVSGWVVTGALPSTRVKVVGSQVLLVTPTGWVMSVR